MLSKPASELTSEQLAQVFTKSFKSYIGGDVTFTAETMTRWIETEQIWLPKSHVFYSDGASEEPIGFAFIGERADKPGESRLVAMGVVPESQGQGIGSACLQLVIAAAKERGMELIELECIQSNLRAFKMYQRAGFEVIRELYGWERDANAPEEVAINQGLQECTVPEVEKIVKAHAADDLPWQAWNFAAQARTQRAFHLGSAWCAISDPDDKERMDSPIVMCSLITEPGHRGQGGAEKLARAMLAKFPGRKWAVPALFPKEYGEKMAHNLGFSVQKIVQYQLRKRLDAGV
jgi:ribosomal protein S18 acetylase RimI-like enzyme